jgi:hypothetical protein
MNDELERVSKEQVASIQVISLNSLRTTAESHEETSIRIVDVQFEIEWSISEI